MSSYIPRERARPAPLVLPLPERPRLSRRTPLEPTTPPSPTSVFDRHATSPHTPATPWTPFTSDGFFTPGLGPATPLPTQALIAPDAIGPHEMQAALSLPVRAPVSERMAREREWYLRGREKTSWLPASYFALSQVGRCMFSMGAVLFEDELYPMQPEIPGENGQTGAPAPPHSPIRDDQGQLRLNAIPGALITIVGLMAAVTALALFYTQARKKKPQRAIVMAALHLSSILLIVGHRFLGNVSAHNWSRGQTDAINLLGWVGAGLNAYTAPNSLCAAESELGHTPHLGSLDNRTEIGLGMVGLGMTLMGVWGSLVMRRGTSPYVRELFFILGSTSLTIGVGLGLTNYRASANTIARGRLAQEQEVAQELALLDAGGPRRGSSTTLGALRRGSAAVAGQMRRGSAAPPAGGPRAAALGALPLRRHSMQATSSPTAAGPSRGGPRRPTLNGVTPDSIPLSEMSPDNAPPVKATDPQGYFDLGGSGCN